MINVNRVNKIYKGLYERQIKIVVAQIGRLVYELYGLTEKEVRVVEGEENEQSNWKRKLKK
ncbi:MAG: hypothetical protein SVY15_06635 [Halobacteriota archaeon]|nr:hypothetical protein [Halobacteriota archaeon]